MKYKKVGFLKLKKVGILTLVLALTMAFAVSAQAYESREAIVAQGHGTMSPSYLVVHETANPGASAANHVEYWRRNASWVCMTHYIAELDGSVVYHTQADNAVAWHVGAANSKCVGIELAHATDAATFEKQWDEVVAWCADYLRSRGWGITALLSHNECRLRWGGTDHTDPDAYFATYGRSWNQFKKEVAAKMNGATGFVAGSSAFAGGTYRCAVSALNVRDMPALSGRVLGCLKLNETVVLDAWYKSADGWIWGRFDRDGRKVYVAVGKPTGKAEADDYLVQINDSFDVDAVARAVIRGEYGAGAARKSALGARYDEVQRRVNELLS